MPSFQTEQRLNNRTQFQDQQSPHFLIIHVVQYIDDVIIQELDIDENCPVGNGVELATFRTAERQSIKTRRNQLNYLGLYKI